MTKIESIMFANHYADSERAPFQQLYQSAFQVKLCYMEKPIVAVSVIERATTDQGYWGWWSNEDNTFHHVWPSRGQVEMCFPYGTEVVEAKGIGRLLPVTVTLLRPATADEIDPHGRKNV